MTDIIESEKSTTHEKKRKNRIKIKNKQKGNSMGSVKN